MDSTRQNKVARLIQKELAGIFQFLGREITAGKMITVTQVRMTPDLSIAKVYVSIFPADEDDVVINNIKERISSIRNQLGQKIRHQVKSIPELHIYLDDSLDYIENIEKLLK
ncbi:MAG: 30S ribosome-binding factor RbfA [Bacteroidales bacterium]|nr:30S ribosome-binding factor RbfA [Bacteroidales bacterium]